MTGELLRRAPGLATLAELARRPAVRRLVAGLLLVSAVGGLAWLILANLEQIRAAPWRLDWPRLLLAVLFLTSTVAVGTWLWVDIAHRLGASWDPRRDARAYAYAMLAKRLPGTLWHVLGRAAYYGESGLGARVGVLGSAIEAGLLVLTGLAIGLAAFAGLRPYGALAGLALLIAGPALARPALRLLLPGWADWLPSTARLYVWTAADALAWLLGSTGVYLLFDALYPMAPDQWIEVVAATTISIVGSAAVLVLPGGLGLRELGMVGVLGQAIPAAIAAALAVVFRVAISAIEVVWAVAVILLVRPGGTPASRDA